MIKASVTTAHLSYRFPILKLPPPPCAVLLVTVVVVVVVVVVLVAVVVAVVVVPVGSSETLRTCLYIILHISALQNNLLGFLGCHLPSTCADGPSGEYHLQP